MFNTEIIDFLSGHRTPALSVFFGVFNFLGEVEGFILVVALIYTCYDKRLAVRASVLVLATMTLNHVLKITIQNPRPFIAEGTFAEKWDVSPFKARELAAEFSTPSGHAMAGSAFYGYLAACLRRPWVVATAIVVIGLIGAARPYIGVHYVGDILLGWLVGGAIIVTVLRYEAQIVEIWSRLSLSHQVSLTFASAALVWLVSLAAKGGNPADLSVPYLGYFGFLTGVFIARPMESQRVGFDPTSGSLPQKLGRWGVTVVLVMIPVLVIDEFVEPLTALSAIIGHLFFYAGYVLAGVMGLFVAPYFFDRLGLRGPL